MIETIVKTCPFCNQPHIINVDKEQFEEYQGGELAQNAFSVLTATEREQIISGICPDCQNKIFGAV